MTGRSVSPNGVSEYSTLGGTWRWILRRMMPWASSSRSCCVSVRWEMPASARWSSLNLRVPAKSSWRMSTFHRPPMISMAVSTEQATDFLGIGSYSVTFELLRYKFVHSCIGDCTCIEVHGQTNEPRRHKEHKG